MDSLTPQQDLLRRELIAQRQSTALALRALRRKGGDIDLDAPEAKGLTWDTSSWPDSVQLQPIISGRGMPSDSYVERETWGLGYGSAVYACINTIANAFMEPPLEIMRQAKEKGVEGEWAIAHTHSIRPLLRKPNRVGPDVDYPVAYSWRLMGWWEIWCKHIDGNAYFYKQRTSGRGSNVTAIWPIRPDLIEPVGPHGNDPRRRGVMNPTQEDTLISYYAYRPYPNMREPIRIDPRDIIHHRLGIDGASPLKGLGPVKSLAREIVSDELASQFTNSLLRNGAIPGLVVIPEEGHIEPEEAAEIKRTMREEFSGKNQGGIAVLDGNSRVEQFGHDPTKMALAAVHQHCETRIAAVLNLPAIVAQLGVAMESASNFSGMHEAREMFTEGCMFPLWRSSGEVLTDQLLPDFSGAQDERLAYDEDKVSAIQQDITARFGRLQIAVKGGWMTANEARAFVRLPQIDEKSQQVPLTQGEDNRYNQLVDLGLVTMNEVRDSIGLPARADGNVLIRDMIPAGELLTHAGPGSEGLDASSGLTRTREVVPIETRRGANIVSPDDPSRIKETARRIEAGLPPTGKVTNPDGTPVAAPPKRGPALRTKAMLILTGASDADEVFDLWQKARGAGMTFAEFAEKAMLETIELEAIS